MPPPAGALLAAAAAAAAAGAGCVSDTFLGRMGGDFACPTAIAGLGATAAELPSSCHVQGVMTEGGGIAITCQGKGGDSDGHVLWYPDPRSNRTAAGAVRAVGSDPAANHPSASQLRGGVLPVAFAKGEPAGPATIIFYRAQANGSLSSVGPEIEHDESHMGALGWAAFNGTTHMVGCGWSCEQLAVWSSQAPPGDFTRTFYTSDTSSAVDPSGVDANVGAYNSIYLTQRCGDGVPLLFGTHGDAAALGSSWIDAWELRGLGTGQVRMKKVRKAHITKRVVRHGVNPIFKEGVTLVPTAGGGDATIYAAPHDYGSSGCDGVAQCTAYVYECGFGT